jgi:hypothetical protein
MALVRKISKALADAPQGAFYIPGREDGGRSRRCLKVRRRQERVRKHKG